MSISRVFHAPSRLTVFSLLIVLAVLLSACSGGGQVDWPGISINSKDGKPGDTIYVTTNKQVVAVNATTGDRLWKYSKDKVDFYAVPLVADDGTVYVGDYKGRMHAIGSDGKGLWIYAPDIEKLIGPLSLKSADRVLSGATYDADRIYFGLGSSNVVAVSRSTGEEDWVFETNHGVWSAPLLIPANPDDENSRAVLYVTSLDHHLYALNPANGDRLWDKDLDGAAPGSPVYDAEHNRIYVGTFLSEMVAVDLNTHDIVDRFSTHDWIWGGPVLKDGVLYFGDLDGYLYAVRATDAGFEKIWEEHVADKAIRATPLLVDDLVIVGSEDRHVYAVSQENGTSRWDEKTKGPVLSEMVLVQGNSEDAQAENLIVVGTTNKDQVLVAYSSSTGDKRWTYN